MSAANPQQVEQQVHKDIESLQQILNILTCQDLRGQDVALLVIGLVVHQVHNILK